MDYFIIGTGESESTSYHDANLLGKDNGFGVFWAGSGLKKLMSIVDKQPELLEHIKIKTDKNETITVDQFLKSIQKLQVRIQR
mgnify:CR=1 FL=1